jgi:putative component of membrane protein insertase Oxa1/YidC/SpoIIIJ protein YidD
MQVVRLYFFLLIMSCICDVNAQSTFQLQGLDSAHSHYMNTPIKHEINHVKNGWYKLYKRNFSELLSANCQYTNTCSDFMKEAIHSKGVEGFLLGLDRLMRCGTADYSYYIFPTLIDSKTHTISDPIEDHE